MSDEQAITEEWPEPPGAEAVLTPEGRLARAIVVRMLIHKRKPTIKDDDAVCMCGWNSHVWKYADHLESLVLQTLRGQPRG